MDALQLFLKDHARIHSSAVGGAEGNVYLEDVMVSGLNDEQLRARPQGGLNSIAWLIWHLARSEDMTVNVLVAGRKQVLEEGGWLRRLGLSRIDIGTGMSDDEVDEFAALVDVRAVRDYRAAVGRRTREVVSAMRPEDLDDVIDPAHLDQAFADGTIDARAGWLRGFVGGKTKAFLLGHGVPGHGYMHLGEAMCLRSLAGLRLPV